jgi:hypothetical protein
MGKRRTAMNIPPHSGPSGLGRVKCPCCGFRTLKKLANDDICPVCYWHDDGQNDENANEVLGGPNLDLSLAVARVNFRSFGAAHKDYIRYVRAPHTNEY